MADLCCQYTLGSIKINDTTPGADRLVLGADGLVGLDGAPIRRQIDPAGQEDGGIVHDALQGPRVIVAKGLVDIQTVQKKLNPAYFAALDAFEIAVTAALVGLMNTPTALSWTSSSGASRSVTVQYGVPGGEIQFPGSVLTKGFQFSLVAEDPTIS